MTTNHQKQKLTDRVRLAWMLENGVITDDWRASDDWPDNWDSEVMREAIDAAILAERRKKKS